MMQRHAFCRRRQCVSRLQQVTSMVSRLNLMVAEAPQALRTMWHQHAYG